MTVPGRSVVTTGISFFLMAVIASVALGAAGYTLFEAAFGLLGPACVDGDGKEIEVNIPRGATAVSVARELKAQGVIKHAGAFVVWVRYRGVESDIKAGDYLLCSADDVDTIIDKLISGEVMLVWFTVQEGLTVPEIAGVLARQGVVDREEFVRLARDPDWLPEWLEPEEREAAMAGEVLEGYLLPDTYRISKDYGTREVLQLLRMSCDQLLGEYWERMEELEMTPHEVLTLASIIEKEAVVAEERELISGVFHNRLRLGMLLGADPTVKYVLEGTGEILTYEDIEFDSPYNTYLYPGLPPGPICNPGKASILAALFPEDTEYLYFVADHDGTHVFTRTYNEHLNAKNRIQGR